MTTYIINGIEIEITNDRGIEGHDEILAASTYLITDNDEWDDAYYKINEFIFKLLKYAGITAIPVMIAVAALIITTN